MTGASIDCCDDTVKDELLRERFPVMEPRNWLCLRASGTGGGTFFCTGLEIVSAPERLPPASSFVPYSNEPS